MKDEQNEDIKTEVANNYEANQFGAPKIEDIKGKMEVQL